MGIRFKHSQRRSLPRGQNPRASVGFAHLLVDATLTQSAAAHHPRGFCFCRMRRPGAACGSHWGWAASVLSCSDFGTCLAVVVVVVDVVLFWLHRSSTHRRSGTWNLETVEITHSRSHARQ
uniref:Uncharacterized protein n=1 Tax=Physcomitrium patens TaxID=3218 RepID=A0A2K1KG54_PHYPA|nr:hypothetical protein PHYPA_009139 [Physcomitrium patens]